MKIGFIGAGKAGSAFGRYLKEQGLSVSGFCSRSYSSAFDAANFTSSRIMDIKEITELCNYIFITTSDDSIVEVWEKIKNFNLQDKNIFHMSGALSSNIFSGIEDVGAFGYSLHPIFPVSNKNLYKKFNEAIFTVEGNNILRIQDFLNSSKINFIEIDCSNKSRYHAAMVFASNYIVSIARISKELLCECGFPENKIVDALYPLMSGSVENIKNYGIEEALTGPAARGDIGTVKKHIESLKTYKEIYSLLGEIAVKISKEQGKIDDVKAKELQKILREDLK